MQSSMYNSIRMFLRRRQVDSIELEPEEPTVTGVNRNMQVSFLQVEADQGIISIDAAPEQFQGYELEVGKTGIQVT